LWNAPWFDGLASIGIASVLLISSLLLARETKGLLIGESARPHLRNTILSITAGDRDVRRANGVLTVQLGANQIVAALSVEFHEGLTTREIELCVERVEAAIKRAEPDVTSLFIKPQSAYTWQTRAAHLKSDPAEDLE
jgi:divalent metal cation (Fe/Co/Zn/Cd) transporter